LALAVVGVLGLVVLGLVVLGLVVLGPGGASADSSWTSWSVSNGWAAAS
jgi:hypothetical protein